MPIWLLTYNYGAHNFQVVINGYTGTISGAYPKSWVKITLAVLAGLVVAGIIALVGAASVMVFGARNLFRVFREKFATRGMNSALHANGLTKFLRKPLSRL